MAIALRATYGTVNSKVQTGISVAFKAAAGGGSYQPYWMMSAFD